MFSAGIPGFSPVQPVRLWQRLVGGKVGSEDLFWFLLTGSDSWLALLQACQVAFSTQALSKGPGSCSFCASSGLCGGERASMVPQCC